MMKRYVDLQAGFVSIFDDKTGFYARTGELVFENGKMIDTGVDPFRASFPQLIDVGIMGHCTHGNSGLCKVGCYQGYKNNPNMTLDNFKKIVDECAINGCFQLALGGRGDVDQHENFEEIVKYCRENGVVPNFTSSGLGFTSEIAEICKKYCGAVAISWYRSSYTLNAIQMLLDAGVTTNIHYVLGNDSIDEAIERLQNNDFPKGINAVVFLLHKNVGLGKTANILNVNDSKVKQFFELVDSVNENDSIDFKIGFDSCSIPGILNFTKNISRDSLDFCEGGRFSMYISADMVAMPCSFDNQELRWGYDMSNGGNIKMAWESEQFNEFRSHFKTSCKGCPDRDCCMGSCPIRREIVLCGRDCKDLQ